MSIAIAILAAAQLTSIGWLDCLWLSSPPHMPSVKPEEKNVYFVLFTNYHFSADIQQKKSRTDNFHFLRIAYISLLFARAKSLNSCTNQRFVLILRTFSVVQPYKMLIKD